MIARLGIIQILTIIFVVLKLTHSIDWAWVLSPLWITAIAFAIIGVIYLLALMNSGREKKK